MKLKTLLWTVIVTILVFSSVESGFTFQNEPDGFRDFKWGDAPRSNMKFLGEAQEMKIYILPNDKLYLGDAQFDQIFYSFYGSPQKLMVVALHFNGKENYDILETICKGKFGKPTQTGFYEFQWTGQQATINLVYKIIEEKGQLGLISTIIFLEYSKAKEKKQIKEAEEDW